MEYFKMFAIPYILNEFRYMFIVANTSKFSEIRCNPCNFTGDFCIIDHFGKRFHCLVNSSTVLATSFHHRNQKNSYNL